jgi:signal peptidase II
MHRVQEARREGLTNPAPRLIDVRVGSATDGRAPISSAERSLSAGPFHWLTLIAIGFAALLADQLTKQLVVSTMEQGESFDVIGPLSIHHVHNSGIAFGIFSTWAGPVTLLTAIAILWMVGYFARSGARHPVLPIALGFLIGGSIGNLVDRIRLGHVTDFLDLTYWPAFNLADTFIVVGVAILMASLVAAERGPRTARRVPDTLG